MKQEKINQQASPEKAVDEITRKEAIKKAGKYAAVTAAAMFVVLSPVAAQAGSELPTAPGW